jgi:hypothetical protein
MVCPICTVAVAAGVGVLREAGVDDLITGMWFGALIVSSIAWMIDYLNRKNVHFLFRKILVIASFYAIFLLPLYYINMGGATILGNYQFMIWGMERLLAGVIFGTIVFILSVLADKYLRTLNETKAMIKWQKVIIPLIFLIITSIIVHLLVLISKIG